MQPDMLKLFCNSWPYREKRFLFKKEVRDSTAKMSKKKFETIHRSGIIILAPQTMHYKGNPSKLPYICFVWSPQNW